MFHKAAPPDNTTLLTLSKLPESLICAPVQWDDTRKTLQLNRRKERTGCLVVRMARYGSKRVPLGWPESTRNHGEKRSPYKEVEVEFDEIGGHPGFSFLGGSFQ